MKIAKKLDIVVAGAFLVCLLLGALWYSHKLSYWKEQELYTVASCLRLYLERTNGVFPGSEQDLLGSGLLTVEPADGGDDKYCVAYEMADTVFRYEASKPSAEAGGMRCIDGFNEYKIRYGTKAEQIQAVGRRLTERATGEQVLLIEGPYNTPGLREAYERVSFELYEKMAKLRGSARKK